MYNHGIELKLLVNGRPMREYQHKGSVFYESRHGTNYTVKIKNDNAYRVMSVLSVDGLDVITGNPAEDVNKGYIIDAYSHVEIKGYRISDTNSAAFIFASKGKSYVANTKGSSRNCGVIGVRVFREKEKQTTVQPVVHHHHHHHATYITPSYPWNPWNTGGYVVSTTGTGTGTGMCASTTNGNCSVTYTTQTTGNVSAASAVIQARGVLNTPAHLSDGNLLGGQSINAAYTSQANVSNVFDAPISYKSFDTGTAWGKKLDDKVKKEYFERGTLLTELVTYYASKSALIDMGIDLEDDPRIAEQNAPQAFGTKYCEPPQGWQG